MAAEVDAVGGVWLTWASVVFVPASTSASVSVAGVVGGGCGEEFIVTGVGVGVLVVGDFLGGFLSEFGIKTSGGEDIGGDDICIWIDVL